jgi:hypothetical protein
MLPCPVQRNAWAEIVGSWADISDRKRVETELRQLAEQVGLRNRFIRDTFRRYLTDEVVSALLESPTCLQMGGEKRKITTWIFDREPRRYRRRPGCRLVDSG